MAGRGVFVAVIAVGIGLLVLKNGFADSGGTTVTPGATTTTPADGSGSTTVPGATTTAPANTAAANVLVANGSGLTGVAKKVTDFLGTKQIATIPPVTALKKDYAETQVYHLPGFEAQAAQVAQQLGGVKVVGVVPNPLPVSSLGAGNVLVIVGKKPIPGVTA
jgi:hypothetical protein